MRVVKVLPELIQGATASDDHNKAFLNIVRLFCEGIMDGGKVSNTFAIPDNVSRVEELGCLSVLSDMPVKALTKCHAHWLVSGKKVFMVSPEFFDVFAKVPLNGMMTDSLPTNLCGFCQLPKLVSDSQGDSFDGFYFFSGPGTQFFGSEDWRGSMTGARVVDVQQETNILSLAWVDKQGHTNFALIPWNGAEILKDLFVGAEYKVKEGFTAQEEVFRLEDGFEDHIRLMCNLLIYLNSGTPDLRQFRNEIKYQSPTSQTPVRRDKELSSLNIELVGFGYKKSPIYSKDIFSQPAYWAHRYFGVGRTEKKYMLVKGSIKTRNRSARTSMSTDKIGFGDAVCEDEQMEYRDTVYVVVSPEQYQVAMELNNKVLNSDFPSYGDTISNFEGRIDNVFIPYNVIGKRSKKANFDLVIQLQLGTGTAFKHGWFRGVIPPLTAKYIEKLTGNSDDAKMLKKMANQAKASTLATMAAAKEKLTKAGVSVSNGKILKADAEKAILVLSNGPVNFVVEHPWGTSFMEQLAEALDHFGIAWAVDETLEGSDGSGMFIGKPSDVEKAELLTSDFLNSDGEDFDQYSEDLGLIDVVVIENDWKQWEPKDDAEALKRVGLNMVCEEDGNNYLVTITRSHSVSGSNQNVVVIDTALKGLAGDAFDHKVYDIAQILKPVNGKVSGGSQGWFIVSDPAKAISLLAKEGIAAHKFTDADKY